MNKRHHLAIVAGAATLLASTALASVYQSSGYFLFIIDSPNWFFYAAASVAAVVGGSIGARALSAPTWVQPIGGSLALLLYVTIVFGDGFLGIVPTPHSFDVIANEIAVAFKEIAELSAPVPVHRGLLLLGVIGVGIVAVMVDFLAVSLGRAALAGLPILALYAVPVTIDRDGIRASTFMLGAAGFLWLLSTEHIGRVQRWGRPFKTRGRDEIWTTTPLGTTGRWLGTVGIITAIAIPSMLLHVLAPDFTSNGGFFGSGRGPGFGSGAGRSVETINPITELNGRLNQKQEVELLRLKSTDKERFYLRLTTLDQFGRTGWTQRKLTALNEDRVNRGITDDEDLDPALRVTEQRSRVEIRAFSKSPYLPIYSNPTKVKIDGDWRWDDQADTVFSSRSTTGRLQYDFDSTRVIYERQRLADARDLDFSDAVRTTYTRLDGGAETQAEALAERIVKGKTSQYEKVMAINDHFSTDNGFRYTTSTQAGTTGSLLMDFLTKKQGYCEQYASAMAFLVRAVGIPARVAVGFTRGTDNGKYISVTNKDAHAWVEVYFAGHGWVPFDPTPPGGTGGRTGQLDWATSADTSAPGTNPGGTPAPTNTPTPQPTGPADAQDRGDEGLVLPVDEKKPTQINVPAWFPPLLSLAFDGRTVPELPAVVWWLLGLLCVLLIGAIPALARVRLRHRRMAAARSTDPVVAAHAAWDELVDVLADLGMKVAESETPRVTARRLGEAGLVHADRHAIDLLAMEEERARYAPRPSHPGTSRRSEATQRILAVQVVGRSLADRATLKVRLRARLLPPSLLSRTSEWLTQVSENMSVGIRDVQAALRQRLLTRTAR